MKSNISTMLSAASLALILLTSGSSIVSAKNKCDLSAFVKTKSGGLNVRASENENSEVITTIPFNRDSTVVHVIGDTGDGSGWLQIDKAEADSTQYLFSGKGWVLSEFLAITIVGESGRVNLLESSKNSAVLTTIPVNTEVKLLGCDGKRALVEYKTLSGWIEPKNQCGDKAPSCM